jgi:putative ABC transport system substrate-binding protein
LCYRIDWLQDRAGRMREGRMLTRRRMLPCLAAACAAASPSFAQSGKTLHLGAIASGAPMTPDSSLGKILIGALADLGYAPGRNLVYAARGALADLAKLPGLIEELRAAGPETLVAIGYPCAAAAKAAGVPTVIFAGAGDPVATGLIDTWAHPGGVVTGISDIAATLTVKRLEFLKAFSPQLKRVAMLWNTDDRAMTLRYQASAETAQTQGLIVQPLGVREPDDFNGAFAAMDRDKPDAILMVADALTALNRKRVFEYAAAHRLPAIYESDSFAREGGLMSYGADQLESLTRAASMVDRIFKGARPGDIPFEQPTRYLFVVNMKTARAMGLEPPVTLLALADDVIE